MPRPSLGPRLWYDNIRENWIIRDGLTFIRTGVHDMADAEEQLADYIKTRPSQPPPPRRPVTGFVYFVSAIQEDFPVKIGFAEKSHARRLRSLQNGCPYPLVLLAQFSGTYKDESGLHKRFWKHRLCGEWFSRTPELMQIIEDCLASEAA